MKRFPEWENGRTDTEASYRYEARPDGNSQLREALLELARQKPRCGYRRLWAIPGRRGCRANVKWIYRIYRAEGLMVRRLKRKRLKRQASVDSLISRPNQEWALDFVSDALATGRALRALTITDSYTGECPGSRQRYLEPAGDPNAGQDH
jgi:putative transposase